MAIRFSVFLALSVACILSAGSAPPLAGADLAGWPVDGPAGQFPPAAAAPVVPDPPVPMVAVRVRVPAAAGAGQELTYRITVENFSPAAAHHVLLRNPLPAHARFVRAEPPPTSREPELIWQLGSLEGGARREILLVLTPEGTGDVQNCARVQFEHGQCVMTKIGQPRPEPEKKLALQMTGPSQGYVNTGTPYQIVVTNPGSAMVANVFVTMTLPPGITVVSGTPGGRLAANQLSWFVASLEPGGRRLLDVVLRAQQLGPIRLEAAASVDQILAARDTVTTTFAGVPAATLNVTVSDNPVEVGGQTRYRIAVRNPGTEPVTQAQVVAIVPEQLGVVKASGPADNRKDGQKIVFEPTTIQPKSEARYEIIAKALRAGDVRVRVELTAAQLTAGAVFQEVSTTIYQDVP